MNAKDNLDKEMSIIEFEEFNGHMTYEGADEMKEHKIFP
jgi:hypothetical protein